MSSKQTEHEATDGSESKHHIKIASQGKRILDIPEVHISNAGFEQGDNIGIQPMNFNEQFCLALHGDESVGLSRMLREGRYSSSPHVLTIPKRVASAANLSDEEVSYHSEPGKILASIDRPPRISGRINVYDVTECHMTRWKNGVYAHQIPKDTSDHVHIGDHVWFWYDILGDGFVFVLELTEEKAPEFAIPLKVQYTEEYQTDYMVFLPKEVCDALGISGSSMRWGHDGERILGLYQN